MKKNRLMSCVLLTGILAVGSIFLAESADFKKGAVMPIEEKEHTALAASLKDGVLDFTGESITTIGEKAYYGNDSITKVILPTSLTTIGKGAFFDCENLTTVEWENGESKLVTISENAFKDTGLTYFDMPDTVKTIGDNAFAFTDLKRITIPASCTKIGGGTISTSGAFYRCQNLTEITFEERTEELTIDSQAFGVTGIKKLELPEGVTAIPSKMCYNCDSLISVSIPASCTSVGKIAFGNGSTNSCTNLEAVIIHNPDISLTETDPFPPKQYASKMTFYVEGDGTATTYAKNKGIPFYYIVKSGTGLNIDAKAAAKEYFLKDTVSSEGLVVNATFVKDDTETAMDAVELNKCIFSVLNEVGKGKTVTVSYGKEEYGGAMGTYKVDVFYNLKNTITDSYKIPNVTYTGSAIVPELSFTGFESKEKLVEGTDYTVTYTDNVNAGTATATFTAVEDGLYRVCLGTPEDESDKVITKTFNILPQSITGAVVEEKEEKQYFYSGEVIEPEIKVTLGDKEIPAVEGEKVNYKVAYADNTKVGTATITVTGDGNYTGTATASFEILPLDLQYAVIEIAPQKWTGEEVTPEFDVIFNGTTLSADLYEVAYADNIDAGTATVTVTAKEDSGYTGSATVEFRIEGIRLDADGEESNVVVELSEESFIYTGAQYTPDVTVKLGETELVKDTDYTVSYGDNTQVSGEAFVKITGKGQYEGTITKEFEIQPAQINKEGFTATGDMIYTGEGIVLTETLKMGEATLEKNTDYTVEYDNNIEPGKATITVTGMGNYVGAFTYEFTIQPITITDTAKITGLSDVTYTGSAITPAIEVTLNNTKLTANTDYEVSYKDNINVGTATVTVTGKNHYQGTVSANFKINAKKEDATTQAPTTQAPTTQAPTTEAPTTQAPAEQPETPAENTVEEGATVKDAKGASYVVTDAEENEVEYTVAGNSKATSVTIPATIKIGDETFKVTSVGEGAFKGNKSLVKVSLGKNITTIEASAFKGCKKLTKVTMGSKVEEIKKSAFEGCKALTSVTIPSKTENIGKKAFYNCSKLKTITIKSTELEEVGSYAIKGIYSKATIKVPAKKLKAYKKLFSSKSGYKSSMKLK